MLITDFTTIGNKFYAYRKKRGLTQAEVAELTNLSERTYADIERGKVNMRTETLLRICNVLKITPNDVLTEKESDLSVDEKELLTHLALCDGDKKETALKLLRVYLDSIL